MYDYVRGSVQCIGRSTDTYLELGQNLNRYWIHCTQWRGRASVSKILPEPVNKITDIKLLNYCQIIEKIQDITIVLRMCSRRGKSRKN